MQATVQTVVEPPTDSIAIDLAGQIMNDLLPGTDPSLPTKSFAPAKTDEGEDYSDLVPSKPAPAKPAEPAPAKPAEPAPAKPAEPAKKEEPEGLRPEDLKTQKKSELPDDLVPDDKVDALFQGKDKEKNAFLKERGFNKTLRTEVQQLREKLTQVEAAAQDSARAKELETQLEQERQKARQLEDELGKIDLTRSPAFRSQYDDKINQVGGKMVQTLISEGVDQNEAVQFVRQVIAETKPAARERLIRDMAPGLEGTLSGLALQIDEVTQTRAAALEKWRETQAALSEVETRQRVAEITGKVDEVTGAAVSEVLKLGNPYFMKTDDADWNKEVEQRVAQVKGVLLTGDFAKIAPLVAEGLTAADLRMRYSALLKQKREVDAELDAVLKGAPRLGTRAAPASFENPADSQAIKEGQSFEEAIMSDLTPPRRR
jgi:hypothetical protein